MPVDTRMIEAYAFYRQYVTLYGRKGGQARNRRTGETEWYGSCPWCGGENRFMFTDTGRFTCSIRSSGCGRHGSNPYWFLRDYEGLNHWEACERLDIDPGSEYIRPAQKRYETLDVAPGKKWQTQAASYVHMAQKVLKSKRGSKALDYLHSRGLIDDTIDQAQLGYIPLNNQGKWYSETYEQWGLEPVDNGDNLVWLPEGILIPWYADGELWKLNIRRLTGLKADSPKYIDVIGSSDTLYNSDAIQVGHPVVLQESAIDALSGIQECRDMAAFVATGGAGKGRKDAQIVKLLFASHTLVSFDDDEIGKDGKRAGDDGAKRWLELIPQAIQWLPWQHDTNDMLKAGVNLREWLALGLSTCELIEGYQDTSSQPVTPALSTQNSDPEPEPTFKCSECGLDLADIETAAYDGNGVPYCDYDENLIACCSRGPGKPHMNYEQFRKHVEQLASVFPGCTVTPVEPGCTLAQRVEQLKAEWTAAEPSEIEQAVMTRLKAYSLFMWRPCVCGCRLAWLSIGSIVCANCEPGGLWSDQARDMLKQSAQGKQAYELRPMASMKLSIPQWLIPGTEDWKKQVERNGLEEMKERRRMFFEQEGRSERAG